jgi:hypothetical protein
MNRCGYAAGHICTSYDKCADTADQRIQKLAEAAKK